MGSPSSTILTPIRRRCSHTLLSTILSLQLCASGRKKIIIVITIIMTMVIIRRTIAVRLPGEFRRAERSGTWLLRQPAPRRPLAARCSQENPARAGEAPRSADEGGPSARRSE